jgi:hypothetical protein
MTMLFYDPYKERKFAEIRGEKVDSFFRVYWENIPQKASKFERKLCSIIDNQKDQFIGEGLSFKGWLDFVPDDLMSNELDIDLFDTHRTSNWNLEPFPSSGKYPKWEMTTFASNKSNSYTAS